MDNNREYNIQYDPDYRYHFLYNYCTCNFILMTININLYVKTGVSTGSCSVERGATVDKIQVRSLSGSIGNGATLTLRFGSLTNPPQNIQKTFSMTTLDASGSTIDEASCALQVKKKVILEAYKKFIGENPKCYYNCPINIFLLHD